MTVSYPQTGKRDVGPGALTIATTIRAPSAALGARLLRGAGVLVSSLFLATCERGPTGPTVPTQLAFNVEPTVTTAGHQITPAVQVTALDARGRPVPGFTQNVTVTLTAGTGTSGATLTGTTTVAAANGVATFYTLSLDQSSTGYTLTATASGLSAATSAPFDINPGPATHLVFTVQPANAMDGATFTPAVQASAQDASGNTVPSFTGQVTVALGGTNPSGGTLAFFLMIRRPPRSTLSPYTTLFRSSTGYTLTATASGLSAATSAPFDVTPGAATHLVFTAQPANTGAGATLTPAVQVAAQAAAGNTVPSFTGSVTVALGGTNLAGGVPRGTTTVAAVNGVASFATLSVDKSGDYWLTARATGLSAGTSSDFSVSPGPATHLAFTVQPGAATASHQIAPAVKVAAQDALGNAVPSFTGTVTVALGVFILVRRPPPRSTPFPSTTRFASFASVRLDKSESCWLTATAPATGLSGGTSSDFSIAAGAATQLAFTVQPSNALGGRAVHPRGAGHPGGGPGDPGSRVPGRGAPAPRAHARSGALPGP